MLVPSAPLSRNSRDGRACFAPRIVCFFRENFSKTLRDIKPDKYFLSQSERKTRRKRSKNFGPFLAAFTADSPFFFFVFLKVLFRDFEKEAQSKKLTMRLIDELSYQRRHESIGQKSRRLSEDVLGRCLRKHLKDLWTHSDDLRQKECRMFSKQQFPSLLSISSTFIIPRTCCPADKFRRRRPTFHKANSCITYSNMQSSGRIAFTCLGLLRRRIKANFLFDGISRRV